jgi:hypothetical protein
MTEVSVVVDPTNDVAVVSASSSGSVVAGPSSVVAHTHPATDINDSTAAGRALLTAANAAAQRTAIGLDTTINQTITANGTGAIARSVDLKLKDVVSVKDFGAVGDGVTDDTAAIQAAVDANQSGMVLFPAGEYKCSATIILTDTNGHNFQGILSGANATITFTNAGASTDTDAAMQHGFRAYPLTNGAGGDVTGMRDVVIEGLRITGPLHGACVYAANSQNVTIQNCQFSQSRYGVAMECCINAKILDNVFDTHFNAGVGMIMSGNTANVWYGSATPATTQWNDSPLIQGNGFLSGSLSSTLAHILDSGSNSESTRLIQGNFFYSRWDGSGPFISTQYGYLSRGGNTTMIRNWFENIPYPVRLLNTNAAEGITNVPGVSGAEPSGTFALSNLVNGFSYNGNFKGNWFARSLISMELSGITGGPCEIGQNISQLLQNGGVHVTSTQSGDTLIVDNGDVIIGPVGTYSYKSLFSQSTYTSLYSKFASYTPTVSSGTGTLTTYTVNEAKFCKTRPDFVTVIVDITINNNGTGATDLKITLPVDFSALIGSATGRAFVGNGYTMTGIINSTGIYLTKYDGSYPVATGDRFIITGQYLVA